MVLILKFMCSETIFVFSVTIKSDSGDVISADRDKIYAHGHWLGRADLAYCMQAGQLLDSTLYCFYFLALVLSSVPLISADCHGFSK